MIVRQLFRDTDGASLLEFAVTAPLFFLLLFGVIQAGLMLWTQMGLQHGVEMAARCASVSDIAITNSVVTLPTPCYSVNGKASANVSTIKSYAAANSYGLSPPASAFSVNPATRPAGTPACTGGNLITASYPFTAITYLYSITLTASSCFPTIAS
jgi:Flp pilus assembly protein TadG